jgi:glucose-6-phosphate isomerase
MANPPTSRWQSLQENYYDFTEVGLALDLSGMAFPQGYIASMEPALRRAFDEMQQLESGAIANPDEQRRVGHYWLRNPALAPDDGMRRDVIDNIRNISAFAENVHSGSIAPESAARFENVLVIGIGGSALGPQLAAAALGGAGDRMRPFFIDNTDPEGIDIVLQRIATTPGGLAGTLTIVTSKSGSTKETRNGMLEVAHAYKQSKLDFARHFVAITCPGSDLDRTAIQQKWLARFPLWDWVGGRTSVMSSVGLLPMALQGGNTGAFLDGAKSMDDQTRSKDARRNPAALLALAWHHATGGAGRKDMVILPYKDRLELFSRYLQQLVMESLGKEKDLSGAVVEQGIAVYGNKGSTDQHAYVQQLRDGVHNFFVTFIEVLHDRDGAVFEVEPGVTSGDYLSAFLQGTRRALHEKGRQTLTITIDRLSPGSLGGLIALYERAVGFYASLVRINAYHQPGVEAGKKAAANVLGVQAKVVEFLQSAGGRFMTVAEIARSAGLSGEEETVFHVLQHLCANPARGVVREGPGTPAAASYSIPLPKH